MFAGGGKEGDLHQYKRTGRDSCRIPQRDIRGRHRQIQVKKAELLCGVVDPHWFQCGSVWYPDPAFFLNTDLDPGSPTNSVYPDPGQTLNSQKVKFYIKNIL
jgi:hypothetical protein